MSVRKLPGSITVTEIPSGATSMASTSENVVTPALALWYAPSPGVIYPTLTMLQDMGLIVESDAAGTRKVYAATLEGTQHLTEKKDEVAALLARIEELKSAQRGDRAPVRRALRNLHLAVAEKVARSDNDELMHKIAALLDEVTQKIERS